MITAGPPHLKVMLASVLLFMAAPRLIMLQVAGSTPLPTNTSLVACAGAAG